MICILMQGVRIYCTMGLPAEFPFVMEPDLVVPVVLPELLSVKSSAKS